MRNAGRIIAAASVLVILAGGAYFVHAQRTSTNAQSTSVVHIRWVVAHQPVSLFDRAQQMFVQVFNQNSDGVQIDVVGLSPTDFGAPGGSLDSGKVFALLDSNRVQMASVVVASLRQQDPVLGVLALPYLFKDYDTTQTVLEGPVGQQLLDSVSASTTAKALAFTFSGGFEVIQTSSKKIQGPADMKGLRIGTPNGAISEDILRAMGATPVSLDPALNDEAMQKLLTSGELDGIEYTYARLYFATSSPAKSVINETYHSLFLTSILVSDSFYDSLSAQNKLAMQKAAFAAARVERSDSLALAAQTKQGLIANGDQIVTPNAQSDAAFKADTASVYTKYSHVFGENLIDSIQAAQN